MVMINERRETTVPLVRIDINKDAPADRVRVVGQAVYAAMIEIANVPINDKFQVVTRRSPLLVANFVKSFGGSIACNYKHMLPFGQLQAYAAKLCAAGYWR